MIRNTLIFLCMIILLSSCGTTKYRVIHKDLFLAKNCMFEKFTEHEKGLMTESIGMKIYRNQENCRIRQERNDSDLKAHNEAHSENE